MPNNWYPEGAGVSISTIDGTLDLSDISWQTVASCGCVCGVRMAAVADELLVTSDQAAKNGVTAAEHAQDVERGFTWRPREHRAAVEEMVLDCTHEPKWGYEKPPRPEGFVWAAVYCLGSRPKFTHLVPTSAVDATKARDFSVLDVKPMCGAKGAYHWHDEIYAIDGKVECKRCIATARKLEVSA